MDIKKEQEEAYYKSIHDELEREFKKAEKNHKEEIRKIELDDVDPPKPTREELRALRLRKLEINPSSS